jgi:hypothetical protein
MRLNAAELQELKEQKPTKIWRLVEQKAEAGKSYSAVGEEYTVLSVDMLEQKDVLRRFGMKGYEDLVERLGPWQQIWLIVVVAGDRTDRPRLLAPSGGKSGDYTSQSARAMKDTVGVEPEAVSAEVVNQFSKAANSAIEATQTRRQKKQRLRSARDLLKKALDGP